MADTPSNAGARLVVPMVLALSLIVFALHVTIVRPYLWPAGAGVTVSGDTAFASMSEPRAIPRAGRLTSTISRKHP